MVKIAWPTALKDNITAAVSIRSVFLGSGSKLFPFFVFLNDFIYFPVLITEFFEGVTASKIVKTVPTNQRLAHPDLAETVCSNAPIKTAQHRPTFAMESTTAVICLTKRIAIFPAPKSNSNARATVVAFLTLGNVMEIPIVKMAAMKILQCAVRISYQTI